NLKTGHRYQAARAVAWAGSGQGEDAPPIDEPARSRWRQQALAWLRADLTLWTQRLDNDPPAARGAVTKALERWQADTAFAGLRDLAALAQLPEKECKAACALWAEVETLLGRAAGK